MVVNNIIIAALTATVLSASEMYPAYVDIYGVKHKSTYIQDSSNVKEFGLYQDSDRKYIYKMTIRVTEPCYIIEPTDWKSHKKLGALEVELVQPEPDTFAGFGGTKHGGIIYNDDLPPHPLYLIGEKGCSEAPNVLTITAYRKSGKDWIESGRAQFFIDK